MAYVKGAIFDLDGTLLDTERLWEDIDREFFRRRGLAMPPDYIADVNTMSFSKAAEYTIERFSLPDSVESLMQEWNDMSRYEYSHSVRLYPGCREYLERLKAEGAGIAAATDLDRGIAVSALRSNGVLDLFDAIVTTGEAGADKRSAKVFIEAAAALDLDRYGCVVYEDLESALEVAKDAGFQVIDALSFHSDCLSLIS